MTDHLQNNQLIECNSNHQISDLLQVMEISRNLAVTQDLQSLLKQIENAALNVINCEQATVFVYDQKTNELYSYVNHRKDSIRIPADQGIAGSCFKTGVICNIQDAYSDRRFNRKIDRLTGFKTRTILAYPMHGFNQSILGVVEVLNKASGTFDSWDETLIKTLAAQCGVVIHRQFLTEQALEKQRIQRDLDLARQIQISLLPKTAPNILGYDIAGWSLAAEETGGDFFDFQHLSNGELLLSIADVAGHGIGSALLAAESSALLRSVFSLEPKILRGLTHVNRLLSENIPDDYFVTAFVGSLNHIKDTLDFVSAGHGPVLLFRNQNNHTEQLPIEGLPLGVLPDNTYSQLESIRFNPGDILIAFTDGFYEWENLQGVSFGTNRIADTVLENRNLPAKAIIEKLYAELLNHTHHTKQPDDLTAIVIKKL